MIVDTRELAGDHANKLAARRRLDPDQLLYRQGITDIVDQRRRIVQPVGIWNYLGPGHVLAAFGKPAMEITDFHIAIEDLLTFELEIEFDGSMSCRMGWPHLQFHDF